MRISTYMRSGAVTLALAVGSAASAGAQLPNASPAATSLSNAFTARARGYDAVAWNPANLGISGRTPFSFTVLALALNGGMDPISLSDVAPYSKKDLPASVRQQWLTTVQNKNGENLTGQGGITILGLSIANVGFQVGTFATTSGTLSPGMFEAMMFGNAGRTGQQEDLTFNGSTVQGALFTTGGLSYGRKVATVAGNSLAIGATVKYTVGNAVAMAQDNGSAITANSVSMNYPVVYSRPDSSLTAGSGVGLDLGGTWKADKLTLAASLRNVLNTFAWDQTKLLAKPGTAFFDGTTNTTNFSDSAYTTAPQSLRDRLAAYKFKPSFNAGMAYNLNRSTTLSFDAGKELSGGIATGPSTHAGGGIEFRWIPLLTLRGGASYVTGGAGFSGGAALRLGGFELGAGASLLSANGGKQPGFALNVLSIH